MTRQELAAFCPQGSTPIFGALNFAELMEDWILNTAWPAFDFWIKSEGLPTWTLPYECRDYASDFRMFVVRMSAKAGNRPQDEDGVALGEVWFRPDATRPGFNGLLGHAINVYPNGRLCGVDPQNGQKWEFSATEWASICTFPERYLHF